VAEPSLRKPLSISENDHGVTLPSATKYSKSH
jgi:hypothetical protein